MQAITHHITVRAVFIWLVCLCTWGYGFVALAQSAHERNNIVISELSEIASEYSFQYAEQWDSRIPFRWSYAQAHVAFVAPPSSHIVVDMYAIGHQPQQPLEVTLSSGGSAQHVYTTDLQFRHYRLLFARPNAWIPSTQTEQLTINTETLDTDGRTLGLAVSRIRTEALHQWDWMWYWEFVWAAITLWMASVWGRRSWQPYHLLFAVSITACMIGIEFLSMPRGYLRGIQLITILVCQDYQRYPAHIQHLWGRIQQWLTASNAEHTPMATLLRLWFESSGIATIGITGVLWLRAGDSAEIWDRWVYLTTFIIASAVMIAHVLGIRWQRNRIHNTMWYGGMALCWIILLWQGFQPELLRPGVIPRFVGFDYWVLLITFTVIALWYQGEQLIRQYSWARWGVRIFAAWVTINGIRMLMAGNDQYHNLFIMNEVLAPVSNRTAYHDFIPHYAMVFNSIPYLLLPWKPVLGAEGFIDVVFITLKICGFALIYLVIRTVAHMQTRPSYAQASILVLPIMTMAAYPWWNQIALSTPIADFLAYIPVRLFSIIIPIAIATWVLERQQYTPRWYHLLIIGGVAGFGMYNNSDFGVFAAAALGIMLVISPIHETWSQRIRVGSVYTAGIISAYVGIVLCYALLQKPLTPEYLFWFQRQYGSGFGALMIRSPGPGGMFIIVTVSLWVTLCVSYIGIPALRTWLASDRLRIRIAMQSVYFASCAAFGLIYYLNRSSAAGQLSINFIPFWVASIGVWRLISSAGTPQSLARSAFQLFIAVPIALSVSFIHLPIQPQAFASFSQEIVREQRASAPDGKMSDDTHTVWPFEAARRSAAFFHTFNISVGYFGPWAHIFATYTDIPSSLLFNRPVDGNVSPASKRALCTDITDKGYTVLIMPDVTTNTKHLCGNYTIITSDQLPLNVAVATEWITTHSQQWQIMREQLNVCPSSTRQFIPCE